MYEQANSEKVLAPRAVVEKEKKFKVNESIEVQHRQRESRR